MIKDHPFTPVGPDATRCKWCMFAEAAHKKTSVTQDKKEGKK